MLGLSSLVGDRHGLSQARLAFTPRDVMVDLASPRMSDSPLKGPPCDER